MAMADYYLCDVCGGKAQYDANIEWSAGARAIICETCAETHQIVVISKASPVPPHAAINHQSSEPVCDRCLNHAIHCTCPPHAAGEEALLQEAREYITADNHSPDGYAEDLVRRLLAIIPAASQAAPVTETPDWVQKCESKARKGHNAVREFLPGAQSPDGAMVWYADRVAELERELATEKEKTWKEFQDRLSLKAQYAGLEKHAAELGRLNGVLDNDLATATANHTDALQRLSTLQASSAQETKRLEAMQPVLDAAIEWQQMYPNLYSSSNAKLDQAVQAYRAALSQPVEGDVPRQTIMGIPVQVSENVPPGEIRLVAPRSEEGA